MQKSLLSLPTVYERIKQSDKPLLLYGMGDGAVKINNMLSSRGIKPGGVVASDGFARGNEFLGHKVMSFDEAQGIYGDFDCVLCFGTAKSELYMLQNVEKRHTVYYIDAPVYGDEELTKELIVSEIETVERVYDLLDDKSKRVYLQNLSFSITGDRRYLEWQDDDFVYPECYYDHQKAHIDVGAFDGDTAIEYYNHSRTFGKLIAIEPDERTYKKLVANTAYIPRVECINAAVTDKNGYIRFASKGSRGSAVGEGYEVKTVTIDQITGHQKAFADGMDVGSIKIDAEGFDAEVLYGAVNTVCDLTPTVSVAVYHRAGDIWRLPYYLHKLCGKYKFSLIREPYILPAWDTFAVAFLPCK